MNRWSLPRWIAVLAIATATNATAQLRSPTTAKAKTSPAGSIDGTVVDANGNTIAGARVELPQFARSTRTSAQGSFRFAGVPTGLWVVRAISPLDSAVALTSVRPRTGTFTRVQLRLPPPHPASCTDAEAPTNAGSSIAVRVRATPERPAQGTLLELDVALTDSIAADSLVRVEGRLAGEPLRFEPAGRRWRAVAALPVDSSGTVAFDGRAWSAHGASAPIGQRIAVADGAFKLERLTVAPEFGRPPAKAIAARMAAEATLAREIALASRDRPRLWRDSFALPRESRVTSEFGQGREFNGQVQSRHMGVDFAGTVGTPVRAANRGVVALVADFYLAGTAVYLDHGRGLMTGYFHLSRTRVAVGDTVARGAVIGEVGATGRVTGPHLHWIARFGMISVDARSALALAARPAVEPPPCDRP